MRSAAADDKRHSARADCAALARGRDFGRSEKLLEDAIRRADLARLASRNGQGQGSEVERRCASAGNLRGGDNKLTNPDHEEALRFAKFLEARCVD